MSIRPHAADEGFAKASGLSKAEAAIKPHFMPNEVRFLMAENTQSHSDIRRLRR